MLPKTVNIQLGLVLDILKIIRRKRKEDERKETDVENKVRLLCEQEDKEYLAEMLADVLLALEKNSYAVIPIGSIEAVRKAIDELNGRKHELEEAEGAVGA
jgi:hypothetical protein